MRLTAETKERPLYGGRALAHGVLMVGPHSMAVAVRSEDGSIQAASEEFHLPFAGLRKKVFLRGLVSMGGAVVLAIRSTRLERRLSTTRGGKRGGLLATLGPVIVISTVERLLALALARRAKDSSAPGIRFTSIVLPMLAMRISALLPSGRSLLQYHAAEHMVVNAVEAGLELNAATAAKQSRIHPRCGTTFAFWALALGSIVDRLGRGRSVRVLAGPLLISLAYEIQRLGSLHREAAWAKIVFGPSWQAQRLTTSPPGAEHLEVACAALQAVMAPPVVEEPPAAPIV